MLIIKIVSAPSGSLQGDSILANILKRISCAKAQRAVERIKKGKSDGTIVFRHMSIPAHAPETACFVSNINTSRNALRMNAIAYRFLLLIQSPNTILCLITYEDHLYT